MGRGNDYLLCRQTSLTRGLGNQRRLFSAQNQVINTPRRLFSHYAMSLIFIVTQSQHVPQYSDTTTCGKRSQHLQPGYHRRGCRIMRIIEKPGSLYSLERIESPWQRTQIRQSILHLHWLQTTMQTNSICRQHRRNMMFPYQMRFKTQFGSGGNVGATFTVARVDG